MLVPAPGKNRELLSESHQRFFAYIENIREEKCCPTKENLPQIPVIFLEFAVINIGKKYLWIIFIFYSLPALVSK